MFFYFMSTDFCQNSKTHILAISANFGPTSAKFKTFLEKLSACSGYVRCFPNSSLFNGAKIMTLKTWFSDFSAKIGTLDISNLLRLRWITNSKWF